MQTISPSFTSNFIAEALNFSLPFNSVPGSAVFTQICTDSRKIIPECLFVALQGEKMDGHDFIDSAITAGAAGIVCRKGFEPKQLMSKGKPVIFYKVENTLSAYYKIAQAWRKQFSIPVVVVAGSVGKTTTKELLAAILSGKYPSVLKTQGSQNGFVGIPMTLLQMNSSHQIAVIEVGIDELGAMEQHMQLVRGTAAILTAIGPEHLEKLKDIPSIAREEGLALSSVAKFGGTVAIHLDDPWIKPHWNTLKDGKKIAYTMNVELKKTLGKDVIFGKIEADLKSIQIENENYILPLPGAHNASNTLGAITLALSLGLTAEQIRAGLKNFKSAEGRSEIKNINGITVICDYYNANPTSMSAGIQLLVELSQGKTKWACLADMLELGTNEIEMHRSLAPLLITAKIDHLLLYGTRMKALYEALCTPAFIGKVHHFLTQEEVADTLASGIKSGDTVLIKGSRSMKMENVFQLLSAKWQKS